MRWLAKRIFPYLVKHHMEVRRPDFSIGTVDDPYMHRWWILPRNPIFNVYLHEFVRSDNPEALHDHPWWNASFLLSGSYVEHTIADGGVHRRQKFEAGDIKFRTARAAHRIELTEGRAYSLFFTGPKIRVWGFHCPGGWKPFQEYARRNATGNEVGRGCDG